MSNSLSNNIDENDAFFDRYTQPEPVRWWVPLIASASALLVLVLVTATVVSGVVTSALGSLG